MPASMSMHSIGYCIHQGNTVYYILFVGTFLTVFTWFWLQVHDFASKVLQGKASLYGFTDETLDSLMLTILPPIGHEYQRVPLEQNPPDEDLDIKVFLLKSLVDALRENAGFHIPKVLVSQYECIVLVNTNSIQPSSSNL